MKQYISDFNANSISTFKGKILLGKQGCIYDFKNLLSKALKNN